VTLLGYVGVGGAVVAFLAFLYLGVLLFRK
jgi:hypothetical protein